MTKFPSNMDMNINVDIIRGRSTSSNKVSLRKLSTHSNTLSVPYHKRIKARINVIDEEIQEPIDSSNLFYTPLMNKGKGQSTVPKREPNVNVFIIRHWPLTTCLNHKIEI